jgi:hypothetical protein
VTGTRLKGCLDVYDAKKTDRARIDVIFTCVRVTIFAVENL